MLIKLDSQNPAHQKFSHELQIERYGYKNTNIPFLTPSLVPTFQEHIQYLQCESLLHYYIFLEEYTYKGVIYLKDNKDICIFIAKKHIGDCCGERCLEEFLVTMKEIPKIPCSRRKCPITFSVFEKALCIPPTESNPKMWILPP